MDRYIMRRKIKKLVIVLLIAAFISGLVPGSIFNQVPTASAAVPSVPPAHNICNGLNKNIHAKHKNSISKARQTYPLLPCCMCNSLYTLGCKYLSPEKQGESIPLLEISFKLKISCAYPFAEACPLFLTTISSAAISISTDRK